MKRILAVLLLTLAVAAAGAGPSRAERKSPVRVIQAEYLSGDPTEPNVTRAVGPLSVDSGSAQGQTAFVPASRPTESDAPKQHPHFLFRLLTRVFGWILK